MDCVYLIVSCNANETLCFMKGQELKILFKEDMAFLTEEVALDFTQVQISESPVKFKTAAFWTIRVINYIENEKRLFVEVLAYQVGETEFSHTQNKLADKLIEIEKVTFKSISTSGLLGTLGSTQPIKFLPSKPEFVFRKEASREPIKNIYNEPFTILIKDISFLSGRVSFEKKIQQFKKSISFEILNENIIEEYDAIKNYFGNVLKIKRIQVIPSITTLDDTITSVTATSIEIEKIDKSLIEEVKFEIVKVARNKELTSDRQLFTEDEYLETFVDNQLTVKKIFKGDDDLFNNLLEKSETKHYNHLRFLSSKHKSDLQKLRLVHRPFSFVFLLDSSDKLYVVWETLDTQEATYLWTFTTDVNNSKQVLERAGKTISLIIKEGKNEYISRNEENFIRIFHDYIDLQNGFKNWKAEIEKAIST